MKTVVIDVRVESYGKATSNYPKPGTRIPLTENDYRAFLQNRTNLQREITPTIKNLLKKGGFIYGSDLWQWYTTRTKYEFSYWLRLKFEDSYNEGKTVFMRMINKTTILNWGKIIKPYG